MPAAAIVSAIAFLGAMAGFLFLIGRNRQIDGDSCEFEADVVEEETPLRCHRCGSRNVKPLHFQPSSKHARYSEGFYRCLDCGYGYLPNGVHRMESKNEKRVPLKPQEPFYEDWEREYGWSHPRWESRSHEKFGPEK